MQASIKGTYVKEAFFLGFCIITRYYKKSRKCINSQPINLSIHFNNCLLFTETAQYINILSLFGQINLY